MRYELFLDRIPSGFSLTTADPNETVEVASKAFLTDSNGSIFYAVLDSFTELFLGQFIEKGNRVSTIDNCLVLLGKSGNARVYVNDLNYLVKTVVKTDINRGDFISRSDIAGISEFLPVDVEISKDEAVFLFFSVGWRRGLFFDLEPLVANASLESLGFELAGYYEYLIFTDIFSVNDEVWQSLFELGWFPFVSIVNETFSRLLARIKDKQSTELTEGLLIDSVKVNDLKNIVDKYTKISSLAYHSRIVEAAVERYLSGDYVSSINCSYPRIEGILQLDIVQTPERLGQKKLVEKMEQRLGEQAGTPNLFLPKLFKNYLSIFYFRDFVISTKDFKISRHSIGHGVSNPEDYSQKTALIGLLILDQLTYYAQHISRSSSE